MGSWKYLWQFTKSSIIGGVIGLTISDRYLTITPVRGISMHPTFANSHTNFPGSLKGDIVVVEKFCLDKYSFSHGDVVVFKLPSDHKKQYVKRIIGLPGEWIQVPQSSEVIKVPLGHCWVEGDNSDWSLDSRSFGPIPLGLIGGRATFIIWPPQRISKVESKIPEGRVASHHISLQ
ncbi:uncharacterized protein A4U43_C01F29670 [Asparagus officinalis]|uniref:Mitochondrial inner membrane protease subunit 2 n=1 Tax=Asparagus officinalis TaxID=4686 RepID=A0A5P1FW81_ASPOF|nr:mitochondrial inner membrane protease subunit 2 [Asparagus officinalis]XP_020251853.1 mitochondrial inner membrane protease subunit 2 [Asparagus officinalis]XP_020251854.1 mitochondrial inner membrane protease subunit 2 [Asparagus officinalis]XP_020251855.1 mitochondrial inner membrane protease subunit 2 [Asparagus officinalis]ONK81489.1 uncharacterized protein A4U43_C01F29670 [Asparagus officinalis]